MTAFLYRRADTDTSNIWSTSSSTAPICVRRMPRETQRCTSVPCTTRWAGLCLIIPSSFSDIRVRGRSWGVPGVPSAWLSGEGCLASRKGGSGVSSPVETGNQCCERITHSHGKKGITEVQVLNLSCPSTETEARWVFCWRSLLVWC